MGSASFRLFRHPVLVFLTGRGAYAWRSGTEDGTENIPGDTDVDHPAFIDELHYGSQERVHKAYTRWKRLDARLERFVSRGLQRSSAAETRLRQSGEQESLRRRALEELSKRAQEEDWAFNPPGHWYFPSRVYVLGLLLLTLLDMPLLYMAFTALGLDPINTGLLSVLTAAVTSAFGHFAGTYFRKLKTPDRAVLYALLGVVACFLVATAYLRESALEALKSDFQTVSPAGAELGLLTVSVASLMVALLLSLNHRVEPFAGQLAAAGMRCRRTLRERRWAERYLQAARDRATDGESRRKMARTDAQGRVYALRDEDLRLKSIYVAANVRARAIGRKPDCLRLKNLPHLSIPDDLRRDDDLPPAASQLNREDERL